MAACTAVYMQTISHAAPQCWPAKVASHTNTMVVHFMTHGSFHGLSHGSAQVGAELAEGAAYHVARKKIPSRTGVSLAGIKLELFIFDTFPSAQRFALMEVARAEEFAPVKNAPGMSHWPYQASKLVLHSYSALLRSRSTTQLKVQKHSIYPCPLPSCLRHCMLHHKLWLHN